MGWSCRSVAPLAKHVWISGLDLAGRRTRLHPQADPDAGVEQHRWATDGDRPLPGPASPSCPCSATGHSWCCWAASRNLSRRDRRASGGNRPARHGQHPGTSRAAMLEQFFEQCIAASRVCAARFPLLRGLSSDGRNRLQAFRASGNLQNSAAGVANASRCAGGSGRAGRCATQQRRGLLDASTGSPTPCTAIPHGPRPDHPGSSLRCDRVDRNPMIHSRRF